MEKRSGSLFAHIFILLIILNVSFFTQEKNSKEELTLHEGQKIPKSLLKIISVDLQDVIFERALKEISNKGGFILNYNLSRIPSHKKVVVKMDNVPAIKVLKKILGDTGTEFKITPGGQLAIVPKKNRSHIQSQLPRGKIKGQIIDKYIKVPLEGIIVLITNNQKRTTTDRNGNFMFQNVSIGNYSIVFSHPIYEQLSKTDILVRPKRITYIKVEMKEKLDTIEKTISVTGSYFHKSETEPHSAINFSSEEVRRSPGSAGDVNRTLRALPGTTNLNDEDNDLVVRGGNPSENAFFVDNIEIPNINHFPTLSSTGGKFSTINPDFIQNVDFYTGGFSSVYGDRLSSIVDITFREGNRDEFDAQIDLSIGQVGGILEGPVAGGKGSWFISGRQSYLGFIKKLGLVDFGAVPHFNDIQAKLTFDLNPKNKITLIDIYGKGNFNNQGQYFFSDYKYWMNTFGVNWLHIWGKKGFSNTSISYTFIKHNDDSGHQYNNQEWEWGYGFFETVYNLRNVNYLTLNQKNKIEFGIQVKREAGDYNYYVAQYNDYYGNIIPAKTSSDDFQTIKSGIFFSYIWNPFKRLTTTIGLRGSYTSFNRHFHLSPRFSISYKLSDQLFLNGGCGIFYQTIPMYVLSLQTKYRRLKDLKAIHFILGLEYLIGTGTKLTLEIYNKKYQNLPIDPDYPHRLIMDQRGSESYYYHTNLKDNGIGYSRGIELLIQKKLVKKIYGILSASYFKSRYKDLLEIWQNRIYDNRYILNLSLGYKPSRKWELSTRWTLIGGAPYTPIDTKKSNALNDYILDKERFNKARYPDYKSINLRVDRRFYFSRSSLIIYLDIWNITNRKNVYSYFWNREIKDIGTIYQLGIIPVLGIEFEF